MKTAKLIIAALLLGALTTSLLVGAEKKKTLAGPKGGRILENTSPHAEFFVEKDHTVTIAFYDAALKSIAVTEQKVTVIAEASGAKTKLEFEKKGDVFVSKTKLPAGGDYNLVVQLKQKTDSKPQNFRFTLDLAACGGCKRLEYACICDE